MLDDTICFHSSVFFFLGNKILSLGNKKKSSVIHIKDFYEKDVPKLSHFKEVFFINHHILTIGSNWSQKYSRFLKKKSTILSNL
jgi:hypothetical protein